jgi:hypothetical protein
MQYIYIDNLNRFTITFVSIKEHFNLTPTLEQTNILLIRTITINLEIHCANFSDVNRDDPTRFASEVGSESAKKYRIVTNPLHCFPLQTNA